MPYQAPNTDLLRIRADIKKLITETGTAQMILSRVLTTLNDLLKASS